MRTPVFALSTWFAIAGLALSVTLPSLAVEQPAACPYSSENPETSSDSTKSTYDPQAKTLTLQVTQSVPEGMWSIAEMMTKDNINKIFEQCPAIDLVNVNFQSGQKMTVKRGE